MPTVAGWIVWGIDWAPVPVGVFAFVHVLLQRADAFTAIDRMTKPAWLGITAGGTAAVALFSLATFSALFWIAGLVAVLVYLVDVRPRLIEVQRGNRW
ncbi:DUF2516 family protein [Actinocrispum wychmicini]|uniref:Uncharacterized protein DUF2516 n=1 Tax=Actinocrispum wychmicini TaxID=1213861 RepID=A0A4R2KF73_9PSEU|nr:DUF2516 family protein [Actinocrispum wychmicini]TCO65185.1 uncharacterized protein DUF2516 [Actinocrispum wychmicini]